LASLNAKLIEWRASMNKADRKTEAEVALGGESQKQAEANPERGGA
jgi:hypothetical protein